MPYVHVQITSGATRAQKKALVENITAALVHILGKRPEHTHVVIQEIAEQDWGYCGVLTDELRAAGTTAQPPPERETAGVAVSETKG